MNDANTIRADLRSRHPEAFADGAECGFGIRKEKKREAGGYPPGFHNWPMEKRNAWFSGFNVGLVRLRKTEGAANVG